MSDDISISTKKCLICNNGKKNDVLQWHIDEDSGDIWVWCCKCSRGYSIYEYCARAGLSLTSFLKNDFDFQEAKANEVNKMSWPHSFIPLYDIRAQKGVEYLQSRGLDPDEGVYYCTQREGIVFPMYYDDHFCGAQIRLLKPWVDEDGDERKIDTLSGTRSGMLFYNYNQNPFRTNIKAIVVCEGAINSISLQQALNEVYGGILTNPFKIISCSGSGIGVHHLEVLKDLKDQGFRIISALDTDASGMKGLKKLIKADVITHYAITEDETLDWNNMATYYNDKKELAKYFLGRITHV